MHRQRRVPAVQTPGLGVLNLPLLRLLMLCATMRRLTAQVRGVLNITRYITHRRIHTQIKQYLVKQLALAFIHELRMKRAMHALAQECYDGLEPTPTSLTRPGHANEQLSFGVW
jgi:hypothetical protein